MPADTPTIQSRLDQLGALQAGEDLPLDPSSAFLGATRRRARNRVLVRAGAAVGGLSLVAAAITLALITRPPAPQLPDTPVATATRHESPTMAWLNRVASGEGELPAFPVPTSVSGAGEAPLRRGAVLSSELTTKILEGR
jgi:hypothetical protein